MIHERIRQIEVRAFEKLQKRIASSPPSAGWCRCWSD